MRESLDTHLRAGGTHARAHTRTNTLTHAYTHIYSLSLTPTLPSCHITPPDRLLVMDAKTFALSPMDEMQRVFDFMGIERHEYNNAKKNDRGYW